MTIFFTFLPLINHLTLPLSHQHLSAGKIGGYRKWGLFYWANHSIYNRLWSFYFSEHLRLIRWGCTRPFLQSSPWGNSLGWVRSGFWWSVSCLRFHGEKLPKNKNLEPGIAVKVVVLLRTYLDLSAVIRWLLRQSMILPMGWGQLSLLTMTPE